ncbi:hypothetical protein IWQ62_000135 [Dispira parvispora]|uniref:RNA helicase n=1 Tax=Dispira parvispora TaxID=1520584 RepID=A0A9W8AZ07_9FUNG|nr:hypothetical protein IWQ62_000135 [Dispira parvispora]
MGPKTKSKKKRKAQAGATRGFCTTSVPRTATSKEQPNHPSPLSQNTTLPLSNADQESSLASHPGDERVTESTITNTATAAPLSPGPGLPQALSVPSAIPSVSDQEVYDLGCALRPWVQGRLKTFTEGEAQCKPPLSKPPAVTFSETHEAQVVETLREYYNSYPDEYSSVDSLPFHNYTHRHYVRTLYFHYEVLLHYGFQDQHIRSTFQATGGLDLLACVTWLCLNLDRNELPMGFSDKYQQDIADRQRGSAATDEADARSPISSTSPELNSIVDSLDTEKRRPNSPQVNRSLQKSPPPKESKVSAEQYDPIQCDESDDDDGWSSSDEFDVNIKHAHARLQVIHYQRKIAQFNRSPQTHSPNLTKWQRELTRWQTGATRYAEDYLFDSEDANHHFALKMAEYDRLHTTPNETLDGVVEGPPVSSPKGRSPPPSPTLESQPADNVEDSDVFSDMSDDQGLFGAMYGDEDGSTQSTTTAKDHPSLPCTTVSYRVMDLSLNKWGTGPSPVHLLTGVCKARDKDVTVRFHGQKGLPLGLHQSIVNIVWHPRLRCASQTFDRPEVAFNSVTEAEYYVATWALFHLSAGEHHRQLPPVLRDEWQQWKEERQARETEKHMAQWVPTYRFLYDQATQVQTDQLRSVATSRLDSTHKSCAVISSDSTSTQASAIPQPSRTAWNRQILDQQRTLNNRRAAPSFSSIGRVKAELPVAQFQTTIQATLRDHPIIIIKGETGCGKSTQVPQYLIENILQTPDSDRQHVLCTQPRRISAMSIAARVSQELGEGSHMLGTAQSLVGYQIRLGSRTHPRNLLTFCTTGILLRRLETDPNLVGVSHVILDEIQERTLDLDFLMLILKRLVQRRPDFRLVLMSATVDETLFQTYFDQCPIIKVPGRTFPVRAFHLEDVLHLTKYAVDPWSPYCVQPSGGDGQSTAVRLKGKGGKRYQVSLSWEPDELEVAGDDDLGGSDEDTAVSETDDTELDSQSSTADPSSTSPETALNRNPVTLVQVGHRKSDPRLPSVTLNELVVNLDLIMHLLECLCPDEQTLNCPLRGQSDIISASQHGAILVFLPGIAQIRSLYDTLLASSWFGDRRRFRIFPLHSSLSSEEQQAVFQVFSPELNVRKIVLATNIAETGITIPDCTVVIDSGKAKQYHYHPGRRVTMIEESFISQANADQRQGRAGRVQPGVCFRLYTQTRYKLMEAFEKPEILRLPLENLCLRAIMYGYTNVARFLASALTPPPRRNVSQALTTLEDVGAVENKLAQSPSDSTAEHVPTWMAPPSEALEALAILKEPVQRKGLAQPSTSRHHSQTQPSHQLTPLGYQLARLPVDVYLGKAVLYGVLFNCLDPILTITAILNSKSPFISSMNQQKEVDAAKRRFSQRSHSDFITMYYAYRAWREQCLRNSLSKVLAFCRTNFLSHTHLMAIEQIKGQLLTLLYQSGLVQRHPTDTEACSALTNTSRVLRRVLCLVPDRFNQLGDSVPVIHATLVAGFYPKLAVYIPPVAKGAQFSDKLLQRQPRFNPRHSPNVNSQVPIMVSRGSVNNALTAGDYLRHYTTVSSSQALLQPCYSSEVLWPWLLYYTMTHGETIATAWETTLVPSLPVAMFSESLEPHFTQRVVSLDQGRFYLQCFPRTAILLRGLRQVLQKIHRFAFTHPGQPLPGPEAQVLTALLQTLSSNPA